MALPLETHEVCNVCDGAGLYGAPPKDCYHCNSTGKVRFGLVQLPTDWIHTFELSEATDDTEYAALSAAQKTTYGLIISMGIIDLTNGTAIRAKLWAMFGSGSTTRDALLALLSG